MRHYQRKIPLYSWVVSDEDRDDDNVFYCFWKKLRGSKYEFYMNQYI